MCACSCTAAANLPPPPFFHSFLPSSLPPFPSFLSLPSPPSLHSCAYARLVKKGWEKEVGWPQVEVEVEDGEWVGNALGRMLASMHVPRRTANALLAFCISIFCPLFCRCHMVGHSLYISMCWCCVGLQREREEKKKGAVCLLSFSFHSLCSFLSMLSFIGCLGGFLFVCLFVSLLCFPSCLFSP